MVGVQRLENVVGLSPHRSRGSWLSKALDYLSHDYHLTMTRMHDRFGSARYKLGVTGSGLALVGFGCGVAGGSSGKEDYDANQLDTEQTTPYADASVPFADVPPVSSGTPDAGGKDTYVPPKEDVSAPPTDTGYDAEKDDTSDGVTDKPDVPVPKDEGSDLETTVKQCLDKDKDGRAPTGTPPELRLGCDYQEDDCNDDDPEVYPGQVEVLGNDKNDDCKSDKLTLKILHGLGTGSVKGVALLVKNAQGYEAKDVKCTTTDVDGNATCEFPKLGEGESLETITTGTGKDFYITQRFAPEVQTALEGDVVMTLWLIEKHPLPDGSPYKDFWPYFMSVTGTEPVLKIEMPDGSIKEKPNKKVFADYLENDLRIFIPDYTVDGVNYKSVMKAAVQEWIDKLKEHNPGLSLLKIVETEAEANLSIVPYEGNSYTPMTKSNGVITSGTMYFDSTTFLDGKEHVASTTKHEATHAFGLEHGQDGNDITSASGGNGKVSNIAACAVLYANTIKGQQARDHIKYDVK